jgi:hypothetical protein
MQDDIYSRICYTRILYILCINSIQFSLIIRHNYILPTGGIDYIVRVSRIRENGPPVLPTTVNLGYKDTAGTGIWVSL